MTKKIFKSTMLVCALVLAVGLVAVMGILYNDFDGQMREELSKEATLFLPTVMPGLLPC